MKAPEWAEVHHPPINFDEIVFYSAPKDMSDGPKSLDEVDPKLLETYEKLGIPLHERAALAGVAVDAVFDSVSVATTFKETLSKAGVIFCPLFSGAQSPRTREKIFGYRCTHLRQLLRGVEFCCIQRWFLRLHPKGCSLPDGIVYLFPNQCGQYRAV